MKTLSTTLVRAYLNRDRNKLGRAFTVAHDELRELLHEIGQAVAETQERSRIASLVDLPHGDLTLTLTAFGARAARSVREQQDCVVCGHVPVNANGVERALHGIVQGRLQRGGGDGCVCGDASEERRVQLRLGSGSARGRCAEHVGVDHARALVDPGDAADAPVAERESARAQLRERVGRHEGACGGIPRCEALAESGQERALRAERGEDFGDREGLADDARRHHERL